MADVLLCDQEGISSLAASTELTCNYLLQLLLRRLYSNIFPYEMACVMAVTQYLTTLMQLIFPERRHRAYRR